MKKYIIWIFGTLYSLSVIITLASIGVCKNTEMKCHTMYHSVMNSVLPVIVICVIGIVISYISKTGKATAIYSIIASLVAFALYVWAFISSFDICANPNMKCHNLTGPVMRIMALIGMVLFGMMFSIRFFKGFKNSLNKRKQELK